MITGVRDRIRYRLSRTVPPYSESVANHVGSKTVVLDRRYEILRIPSCVVWHRYSAAFKGSYIARETVKCPDRTEWLYDSLKKYPVLDMEGVVTTIGDLWSLNYYHKFVDMIPKLFALQHEELQGEPMTLVLDERFTDRDMPLIRALLPDNVETATLHSMRRIACDAYVHLPRLSTDPSRPCKNLSRLGWLPDSYVQWYRSKIGDAFDITFDGRNESNRIYISRRHATKRRMVNEGEIYNDVLAPAGFTRVFLEELSLLEQMRLFSDAAIVIGQHGAGLTNLLYVPKGTAVVEIFSSPMAAPPHYSNSASLLGLDYRPLHMQPVGTNHKDGDGFLPKDQMERVLKHLEARD